MKLRYQGAYVVVGIGITVLGNMAGAWWLGYLVGAGLGIAIRPRIAAASVAVGWAIGFALDAISGPLLHASQVIAAIAGLPSSVGILLVILPVVLAYFEGLLPALLTHRLRYRNT
ncbi:MAG: hypothetical protein ACYDHP_13915 [Ferrimicrobium sp.]